MKKAAQEDRIVVTNDKDFGTLVFRGGRKHAGIILLRLRDESPAKRVAMIDEVIQKHADQVPGSVIVATEKHIRIRSGQ